MVDNNIIVEGGINRDLESTRLWFKENGMMPNPKKYQAIVLGRKGCDIKFQCANETIPTSNEINLLGVTSVSYTHLTLPTKRIV